MKRLLSLCLLISLTSFLFGACVSTGNYPNDGIWYCEDLEIYLDMNDHTGVHPKKEGGYVQLVVHIDYGSGFFIESCESGLSDEYEDYEYIRTDYKYRNGALTLADRDSDKVYKFIKVDEELYPGG